jgi:hypothetical protein
MRGLPGHIGAAAVASCLLLLQPADLSGEPYLSVRTGLKCSQCHVNKTGGGGRTDFGSIYAQTRLPMVQFGFLKRSLNDFLSIGANFRVLASGTARDATDAIPRSSVEITEQSLQLEAQSTSRRLREGREVLPAVRITSRRR